MKVEHAQCGEVLINDAKVKTVVFSLPHASLIIAAAPSGFVMCGYLDIAAAEKIGDAACVVGGVKTVDELLNKPVVKLTKQARELGITTGMSGRDALRHMF